MANCAWFAGEPYLFDIDGGIGCIDGISDYDLALGLCDSAGLSFDAALPLMTVSLPAPVCIRGRGGNNTLHQVVILSLDSETLRFSLPARIDAILDLPFSGGLPRSAGISGLVAGVTYELSVTLTDGNTAPVAASADFVYQGESRVIINNPPHAVAEGPAEVECDSGAGASISLEGQASQDQDSSPATNDDIVLFEWLANPGEPDERPLGEGEGLTATLPLGALRVGLRVTDAMGEQDLAVLLVAVRDTTPPTFTVQANPSMLWPPDNRLVPVHIAWQAADKRDPAPRVELVAATMSDAPRPSGGSSSDVGGDIFGAEEGTADAEIILRARRHAREADRVYQLLYRSLDSSGNITSRTGIVRVPHDLGIASRRFPSPASPAGAGPVPCKEEPE